MNRARARAALERELHRHRDQPTTAPRSGWINAIREALGMSSGELATRLGVSRGRIGQIEHAEQLGTLKIDTLERAAAALGCRLEYVLVPEVTLDEMVQRRARVKASAEIGRVVQTMALEDQQPSVEWAEARVEQRANELVDRRGLWA